MVKFLIITLIVILVTFDAYASECPKECNENECIPPVDCPAGFVKDNCNCCSVCGALEGEKCYNEKLSGYQEYNKCGNQMLCDLNNYLDDEKPEALCKCLSEEKVCGSDGNTYNNQCHLAESSYKNRDTLIAIAHGPCKFAPKLMKQPINVINKTGSYVTFTCIFSGWPLPAIEWRFISAEKGNSVYITLPGDVRNLIVQTRGGPKIHEITSIVQISYAELTHEGYYQCTATNEIGDSYASAKLSLSQRATRGTKIVA